MGIPSGLHSPLSLCPAYLCFHLWSIKSLGHFYSTESLISNLFMDYSRLWFRQAANERWFCPANELLQMSSS